MGHGRNILIAAVTVALSSIAFGQSKPANPSIPEDAQISSPRWTQGTQNQPCEQNSLSGPDQLVTQAVMAVPQAKADAVVAKWTFRRLTHDLSLLSNFMLRDFRDSEEYDQAYSEFQTAYDEYESARTKALAGIRGDDRYQAALSIRKNVGEQIADEHDQKEPDHEKLVSLAGLKLDTISTFREQERDTLAADQNVASARDRLIAAGKKLARMEKDFARTVRNDDALASIRKSREDARIAMLASGAYLDESRTARDIALRYAYVARGYDRYVPRLYGNYGYGGYGYGGIGYGGIGYGIRSTGIGYPIGYVR
jgi:hypothetical protein